MFAMGNLVYAIATILDYVLTIANWLIIIRALISWVNPDPYNPIVQFLYKVTEPILAPFRRLVPMFGMGLDISPIFALILIWFVKLFVVRTLFGIAMRIG
ncbi:MAG: YggT family protein [Candidatus Omnitrophica bacterium]|nr:YggT family protein [Candidatus Omnitrophota bacterium]MDD5436397.1 YggT family protein [Candidatus Omnitrophota bacterium]